LIAWLPTLYTMFYGLSVQQSLRYSVAMGFSGICGSTLGFFLIDRIGRRRTFLLGFLGSAAPLLWLGSLGVGGDAFLLMTLTTVCGFFGVLVLSGIYVYAPEIYPTHLRALGTGVGTAWIRIGAILSPALIGWALPHTGVANVFLGIAGAALIGALGTYLLVIETRGRSLEELGGA
jgi:putative MFS transporter